MTNHNGHAEGINSTVDTMREELRRMEAAGSSLADMEDYMSDQASMGGDFGLVWMAYMGTDKRSSWLEDFLYVGGWSTNELIT